MNGTRPCMYLHAISILWTYNGAGISIPVFSVIIRYTSITGNPSNTTGTCGSVLLIDSAKAVSKIISGSGYIILCPFIKSTLYPLGSITSHKIISTALWPSTSQAVLMVPTLSTTYFPA